MIEIYRYEPQDIEMKFNKWAWPFKSKKALKGIKKYLEVFYGYTIYDTNLDKPVAILGFHEYEDRKFYGCIIASKLFEKNPKYAIKMKFLIGKVREQYGAERVETISEDAPKLNKWHEFLGFHKEESLPNHYQGRDFILWSM